MNRQKLRASRIIWKLVTGDDPSAQVDHKNLNRADNRWCNLRLGTNAQNQWNRGVGRANTSGFKGVHRRPSGRYQARIGTHGSRINLGHFPTPEGARAAYAKAAKRLHGEFARSE